ncbi:MAG TPA: sulfite exporter TauE/SafE family protein [Pirellulales bacterium]|jgi:hypothetical protein|nr:sulfite exporter TauE/SafE family protein [Pirellulales bacterium]
MDHLSPLALLVAGLSGLGTGALGAILGSGGGVFLIPILVVGLGVPVHFAVATSIVSVIATSSAVASSNVERGTANMRLGMTLEVATALGAISGGLFAGAISPQLLEGLFAVVLLPTALLMWRGVTEHIQRATSARGSAVEKQAIQRAAAAAASAAPPPELGALGARYQDATERAVVAYRVLRLPAGLFISLLAGMLSGLLGIGGGVFKVPALHLACGVPMKAAAATSNFMIGVTAAASAFLYLGRGEIRPSLTAAVVLGILAGSFIGTALNQRIQSVAVRKLFSVLLVAVAGQMLYRAFAGN